MEKLGYIIRGLPGSGKSYEADQILLRHGANREDSLFRSDDFWVQDVLAERAAAGSNADVDFYDELEKEVYRSRWSPETLGKAHKWNFSRFMAAVEAGVPVVIADSVNGKCRDMRGYVRAYEQHGYKVIITEPSSPWWLDHAPMLRAKQENGTALENFARFLAGFHQGYEAKYGAKGNQHGVPLDAIRNMIRSWQCDVTPDDVMMRSGRFL